MKCAASLSTATLSLVALLTLGRAGHAQAAPDGTWRAVVVDGATEVLTLIDPAAPKPVPVGPAVPGFTLELRDPSRLVFLRVEPHATTATIFSEAPARTLGPISLGDYCPFPDVGPTVGASAGAAGIALSALIERHVIADVPDRLILSCTGMLVSLDLERGTAATQPTPRATELRLLEAGRVLAVEAGWRDRPFTTEVGIYDARTLAVTARVKADGFLVFPGLVPGGREIVLIDIGDELTPGPPTRLRYFDASTASETRTVSLGAPFRTSRMSADGRFVYATNMNRNKPKQTARELRILRAETGDVLEKVQLLEHASWFPGDRSLPAMIEDVRFKEPALSRLVILDEGRVRARLPIHGYVHQLSVDRARGRMYLLDNRSLAVYTWPDLELEKQVAVGKILDRGGQPELFMSLAPDATRAVVVSGSRVVAVDLDAGTALPEARLGSSGARARRFWANVAVAPLVMASQGGAPDWTIQRPPLAGSRLDPVPVAFSADGRRAMLPAPTGQITTIDMVSGRALSNVPGGDSAIAFAGVPFVINADKQSSWVLSVATGDVAARFTVPAADAPLSASVSPDGLFVLIGRGAEVHLLEAATGRPVQEWTGFGRIGAVHFLRDVPTP